jgi:hypothetical protein
MTVDSASNCACLDYGPRHPNSVGVRVVGVDETDGRFAYVTLERCTRCQQLWVRYLVEYEALSMSGRWALAPIDEALAATMTPEQAAGLIADAKFNIRGGSYFGGKVTRGRGPIHWGM